MKNMQVLPVKQLLAGSFNYETNQHRQFIPVPLLGKCRTPNWACDYASSQCGEGKLLKADEENEGGRYLLLVESGSSAQRVSVPPGDWIIEYAYTRNDGINEVNLFLAAEVA